MTGLLTLSLGLAANDHGTGLVKVDDEATTWLSARRQVQYIGLQDGSMMVISLGSYPFSGY